MKLEGCAEAAIGELEQDQSECRPQARPPVGVEEEPGGAQFAVDMPDPMRVPEDSADCNDEARHTCGVEASVEHSSRKVPARDLLHHRTYSITW